MAMRTSLALASLAVASAAPKELSFMVVGDYGRQVRSWEGLPRLRCRRRCSLTSGAFSCRGRVASRRWPTLWAFCRCVCGALCRSAGRALCALLRLCPPRGPPLPAGEEPGLRQHVGDADVLQLLPKAVRRWQPVPRGRSARPGTSASSRALGVGTKVQTQKYSPSC
jgi:hypothetical protein